MNQSYGELCEQSGLGFYFGLWEERANETWPTDHCDSLPDAESVRRFVGCGKRELVFRCVRNGGERLPGDCVSGKFSGFRRREGECNAGCVSQLHESNGL